MIDQFQCDVDILTTADSGPRPLGLIFFACFHTTENDDSTRPDDVARWQLDRSNESSYNVLFGVDGRTVRGNDDNYKPWSAGWTANARGVHGAAVGFAARTREQWLAHPKQLESMARWAANVGTRYNLPFRWLTPEQLREQVRGFCGHAEVSAAWREVNHTDPGPGFPHDVVMKRAAEIANGEPEKVENMSNKDIDNLARKLDLVLDQLAGYPGEKFPGWEQLGDRTVVDALGAIGAALNVPGCRDTK